MASVQVLMPMVHSPPMLNQNGWSLRRAGCQGRPPTEDDATSPLSRRWALLGRCFTWIDEAMKSSAEQAIARISSSRTR